MFQFDLQLCQWFGETKWFHCLNSLSKSLIMLQKIKNKQNHCSFNKLTVNPVVSDRAWIKNFEGNHNKASAHRSLISHWKITRSPWSWSWNRGTPKWPKVKSEGTVVLGTFGKPLNVLHIWVSILSSFALLVHPLSNTVLYILSLISLLHIKKNWNWNWNIDTWFELVVITPDNNQPCWGAWLWHYSIRKLTTSCKSDHDVDKQL